MENLKYTLLWKAVDIHTPFHPLQKFFLMMEHVIWFKFISLLSTVCQNSLNYSKKKTSENYFWNETNFRQILAALVTSFEK